MSSRKQSEANKRNAQKSTGPRTSKGKLASSRNAVKHGLLAKHIVITGENPEDYESFKTALYEDLSPNGPIENELVDLICSHAWRLRRIKRLEAALMCHQPISEQIDSLRNRLHHLTNVDMNTIGLNAIQEKMYLTDEETAECEEIERQISKLEEQLNSELLEFGGAFLRYSIDSKYEKAAAQLNRHETSIERAFYRALHELQRIQAMRAGRQTTAPIAVDIQVDDSGDRAE